MKCSVICSSTVTVVPAETVVEAGSKPLPLDGDEEPGAIVIHFQNQRSYYHQPLLHCLLLLRCQLLLHYRSCSVHWTFASS